MSRIVAPPADAAGDSWNGTSVDEVQGPGRVGGQRGLLADGCYDHDVVIDRGVISRRGKGPSKPYWGLDGHTPLSIDEVIPWGGTRLVVGTGADGALPVMPEIRDEARRRGIKVIAVPTREACRLLDTLDADVVRAVLHVTC
jgi:hypothetical protein